MENTSTTSTFSTKDYYLSGALMAAGERLLRLDWREGRAFFVFENLDRCEMRTQAYWVGDLKVSAKAFTDALRTLKDRLYSNGNGHEQKQNSHNRQ